MSQSDKKNNMEVNMSDTPDVLENKLREGRKKIEYTVTLTDGTRLIPATIDMDFAPYPEGYPVYPALSEVKKVNYACDICPIQVECGDNHEFDCQVYSMFQGFCMDKPVEDQKEDEISVTKDYLPVLMAKAGSITMINETISGALTKEIQSVKGLGIKIPETGINREFKIRYPGIRGWLMTPRTRRLIKCGIALELIAAIEPGDGLWTQEEGEGREWHEQAIY